MREQVWTLRLDKKAILMMILGVLMNILFFWMAQKLRMPLWLDTTGTLYVAMTLGPMAGLIVGLCDNILLAVFFHGLNALFFFLVSGYVAITAGVLVKSGLIKGVMGNLGLVFLLYVGSMFLSVFIGMLLNHGQPNDYYGTLIYQAGKEVGFGNLASSIIAHTVVKLLDTCISFILAWAACLFTPRRRKRYQY